MKKITEIKEIRYRTVREKDALGNRKTRSVPVTVNREVKVISGGKRFAHFFVDLIVYQCIYQLICYALSLLFRNSNDDLAVALIFIGVNMTFFFLFPLYYIVFEHFFQKTPGKFLTKCRVIDIYGNRPEAGTNILRNLIRWVPFEAFSCLFNERGWHDRWSDTFVVPDEEYEQIKALLDEQSGATFATA